MLEQVVRPFETNSSINDKATPITSVITIPPEQAILTWGAVGQAPDIFSINFFTTKPKNTHKELSRKSTDVRVQNPDDPNQYLIAQRIDSIQFDSTPLPGSTSSDNATVFPSSSNILPADNPTVSSGPVASTGTASDTYFLNQTPSP